MIVDDLQERRTPSRARFDQVQVGDTIAPRAGDRHHAEKREALVTYDLRIAHDDTWPHTALFVPDCRIEFYKDYKPAPERH